MSQGMAPIENHLSGFALALEELRADEARGLTPANAIVADLSWPTYRGSDDVFAGFFYGRRDDGSKSFIHGGRNCSPITASGRRVPGGES